MWHKMGKILGTNQIDKISIEVFEAVISDLISHNFTAQVKLKQDILYPVYVLMKYLPMLPSLTTK